MNLLVFVVFCFLLILAAYAIIRTRLRMYTCHQLLMHVKPLSEHAREVLAEDTQGDVPSTWLEFGDLYRAANNLTWLTMLADRFKRAMSIHSVGYSNANMKHTYVTFMRKRSVLWRSLGIGFAHLCFGKIGRRHSCVHMAKVARNYTDVLLVGADMAEAMDRSYRGILEGQFLHGS
jgi:hypothetical protein